MVACRRGGAVLARLLLLLGLDLGRGLGVAAARLLPAVVVLAGVQLRRPPSLGDRQAAELRGVQLLLARPELVAALARPGPGLGPGPRSDMRLAPGAKLPLQEARQRRRRRAPQPGCRVLPWSGPSRLPELEPEGPGGEPILQGRSGTS